MIYKFKQDETESIINRFGKDFYEKVLSDIEKYANKWKLKSFYLIPSYSANLVFTCNSEKYGNAILKIGNSFKEISTEYNALCEYNSRRFCKVFDADIENGVMLVERIEPGKPLRDENSLVKRLSVISDLYNELHIAPIKSDIYPTYTQWVNRITDYMSKRQDCKELYAYMQKAKAIYLSVSERYSKKMLIHGDFHHDNILQDNNGKYIIIDPKGVIGDPIFDVPRFILNEYEYDKNVQLYNKINHIINNFEKSLDIPNEIIKKCLYVETAMGECWSVEDGSSPEDYPNQIKTVAFAESL